MIKKFTFDKIRSSAIKALRTHVEQVVYHGGTESMLALVSISRSDYGGQAPALREFASKFNARRDDWVAQVAKTAGQPSYPENRLAHTGAFKELCAVALKAREEGVELIERWDVRAVSTLIDLFPEAVPVGLRRAGISCYMADDEDSTWMVVFDTSVHRPVTKFHDETADDESAVDASIQREVFR